MFMQTTIPDQAQRLLPLLSTDKTGELTATRDAIGRALQRVGLDWHSIELAPKQPCARSEAVVSEPPFACCFGDLARAVRDLDDGRLSARERAFVADVCKRGWAFVPSKRQRAWMADLYQRLCPRRAAA